MLPISINIGESHSFLGLSTEIISGIVGALVGVVGSGIISWVIQASSWRVERRAREADRLHLDQALGHSILAKLMKINADLAGLKKSIDESFQIANENGVHGKTWQGLRIPANTLDRIVFEAPELALILSLRDSAALQSMIELEASHNSILSMVELYGNERRIISDKMDVAVVDGFVFAAMLSPADAKKYHPKIVELNSLVSHIIEENRSSLDYSVKSIERMITLLNEKRDLNMKITMINRNENTNI